MAVDDNATLRWYRGLIALRRQYVSVGERTCRAELCDSNILLQVPREQPRIMVLAGFPESLKALPVPPPWREVLSDEEDGYSVRVLVSERG
jgi:glycosidase